MQGCQLKQNITGSAGNWIVLSDLLEGQILTACICLKVRISHSNPMITLIDLYENISSLGLLISLIRFSCFDVANTNAVNITWNVTLVCMLVPNPTCIASRTLELFSGSTHLTFFFFFANNWSWAPQPKSKFNVESWWFNFIYARRY